MSRFYSRSFLILLIAGVVTPAAKAQELIKDLRLTGGDSFPTEMTEFKGDLYYFAASTIYGTELWKTDGVSGATLVKDIVPGRHGVNAFFGGQEHSMSLTVVGDVMFFVVNRDELWKTDGTAAGTVLVSAPVPVFQPTNLTAFNGELYFIGRDHRGRELWKSDGTQAGTVLVKDIRPGASDGFLCQNLCKNSITEINGSLLFFGFDDTHGRELWKTDGTEQGTVLVKDINPSGWGAFEESRGATVAVLNGELYFSGDDGTNGTELWKTDGTESGTAMVKDLIPGSNGALWSGKSGFFTAAEDVIYFVGDVSFQRIELWKTDGTESGTQIVRSGDYSNFRRFHLTLPIVNNLLFFTAADADGDMNLWTSDGTDVGTQLVKALDLEDNDCHCGGPKAVVNPTNSSEILFFAEDGSDGFKFWASDGTAAGTRVVADLNFRASNSGLEADYVTFDGNAYFAANDGTTGLELWRTDGTANGTQQVADIAAGSSYPGAFADLDGSVVFQASDDSNTVQLWISDGSELGTIPLKELYAGVGNTTGIVAALDGRVVFATESLGERKLWITDGTEAGTEILAEIVPHSEEGLNGIVHLGNDLLFAADDGANGTELWKTDGTAVGTVMVKDISPGTGSSYPLRLTRVGNEVFFGADDEVHGFELWKSDGTGPGTVLIADIYPGDESGIPDYAEELSITDIGGGVIVFPATDGIHGGELWKSDGSEVGTVMIKDIYVGSDDGLDSDLVFDPPVLAGEVYFAANDGIHGLELWKTDGTEAGTILVKDINAGPTNSIPDDGVLAVKLNDRILVTADDGIHGEEWWVSDGTESGTSLLKDIFSGPSSSVNGETLIEDRLFVLAGSSLYFVADDGHTGRELWSTQGDEASTSLVMDIAPSTGDANIGDLTIVGSTIFFAADDGVHGVEPWRLGGIVTDVAPLANVATDLFVSQPFPNPFRTSSRFVVKTDEPQHIDVEVFDLLGRVVMTIYSDILSTGMREFRFDGSGFANGVYFVRVSGRDATRSVSVVMVD